MYGKLIDGDLFVAPKNYTIDNNTILNFNLDEGLMRKYGFKLVIEAEKPDYPYTISYEETEDEIKEIVIVDMEGAKEQKTFENNILAKEFRYNQTFTVEVQGKECVFDTSDETQRDLNTATDYCLATGKTYDNWTTNNGVVLNLTIEDINTIFEEFKVKADVYAKWLEFDTAIEAAETIKDLEAIVIDYDTEEASDVGADS